jgi:hypothetical protein
MNTSNSVDSTERDFHIETMEFKNVDGISILADMYIPHARPKPLRIGKSFSPLRVVSVNHSKLSCVTEAAT